MERRTPSPPLDDPASSTTQSLYSNLTKSPSIVIKSYVKRLSRSPSS